MPRHRNFLRDGCRGVADDAGVHRSRRMRMEKVHRRKQMVNFAEIKEEVLNVLKEGENHCDELGIGPNELHVYVVEQEGSSALMNIVWNLSPEMQGDLMAGLILDTFQSYGKQKVSDLMLRYNNSIISEGSPDEVANSVAGRDALRDAVRRIFK